MYRTEQEFDTIKTLLRRDLEDAYNNGWHLVDPFRQTGKTSVLIEFAKEKNLPVIVFGDESHANALRSEHDYERIYAHRRLVHFRHKEFKDTRVPVKILVDENIPRVLLNSFENYIEVAGGYR